MDRPGGLTALAVLNFIFSAFGILAVLLLITGFLVGRAFSADREKMGEAQRQQVEALDEMGAAQVIGLYSLELVTRIILGIAGFGYLTQRKILGRMFGNVYGVIGIVSSACTALVLHPELGGGFSLATITALVYPLITLLWINTTFKDDFIR